MMALGKSSVAEINSIPKEIPQMASKQISIFDSNLARHQSYYNTNLIKKQIMILFTGFEVKVERLR